jgi:hypothetical protein
MLMGVIMRDMMFVCLYWDKTATVLMSVRRLTRMSRLTKNGDV